MLRKRRWRRRQLRRNTSDKALLPLEAPLGNIKWRCLRGWVRPRIWSTHTCRLRATTSYGIPLQEIWRATSIHAFTVRPKVRVPVSSPEIERRIPNTVGKYLRPDISLWDSDTLVGVIEVIDTNPPTEEVLEAESEFEFASYVTTAGECWCSPDCYRWSKEGQERAVTIPCCEYCEKPFTATAFPEVRFVDWESPIGEICAECTVQHLDGSQYKAPGGTMDGHTVPNGGEDTRGLILALTDAVFWAGVWASRAQKEAARFSSQQNEVATATQLDAVERSLDSNEWKRGSRLLSPIGAPNWSADRTDPPLFAWEPDNCLRTAALWSRVREWRATQLPPSSLRRLVKLPELPVPGT